MEPYLHQCLGNLKGNLAERFTSNLNMESVPGNPINPKEYDGLSGKSSVPFHIKLILKHRKVEMCYELQHFKEYLRFQALVASRK